VVYIDFVADGGVVATSDPLRI